MTPYAKFKRKWVPKTYAKQGLQRAEREHGQQLKAAPPEKRGELKNRLTWELWEWIDWVQEIEDAELIAKAAKMDVYLDGIPAPFSESEERHSHHELGTFGNRYLHHETRVALQTKMRERAPAYRKERREVIELYIKIATVILTGATGLLGTATGLVALLKSR